MTRRRATPRSPAREPDLFAPADVHIASQRESHAGLAEPAPLLDLARASDAAVPGANPDTAVAVSSLTQVARDVVEGAFVPLWVRGEVTDFKAHRNGHWYFSLRDDTAQLRCVVWKPDQRRIPAAPDDGMQVTAFGQPTVYTARGDLQLRVTRIEAEGEGLWRKALEQARARLEREGLLRPERKRPLPRLPRCVAVVTSPDGAALHDILAVMRRRCCTVDVVVVPARVQGDGAAEEIIAAIARVNRWRGADILIVGRGGGAREDLRAFNDERVARAVAACAVPTISAVGHEVDVTLCDLVADLRAPTPSAAAEAAVPVLDDERAALRALRAGLHGAVERALDASRERLQATARAMRTGAAHATERRRARVRELAGRLNTLSPLATLQRGYAVAQGSDGRTITTVAALLPERAFRLTVSDGSVDAVVAADPRAAPLPSAALTPAGEGPS
ncbi:MAG TPA: exodeoxyribonuclease VII large subunit [Gemmatimonadaceae bacterium]|nr:exodeoxyribonuclease VII large subunit [Gemmatimonadaceae bacterium]